MRSRNMMVGTAGACSLVLIACGSPASSGAGGSSTSGEQVVSTSVGPGASTAASGATSGSGGASYQGTARVDASNGTAVPGSADVAVAPDGTLYVTWVDTKNGSPDVFIARSKNGGASFEPAIQLDDATITPLVSMARHPYAIADNDRVAVVFNDQPGTIYLYVAPSSDLAFGSPTLVGSDLITPFRDFPKAFFLADGKLAVAWHGYAASGSRMYLSRESDAFVAEEASTGAPGIPCECCPLDALSTSGGDIVLAFRNNDNDTREMWSAQAPAGGAFSAWAALSSSEGTIQGCPMQGPRIAEPSPGNLFSVWSTRGTTNPGSVYFATSSNDGASWSVSAPLGSFVGDEPTIAVGAAGHIYVTGVNGGMKSSLVTSVDGGSTWSAASKLSAPDGDLATPQLKGRGGVVALAAVSKAGSVWLKRLE